MVFTEARLCDNKLQTNDVCFPGKKDMKEYWERKSDDAVRL